MFNFLLLPKKKREEERDCKREPRVADRERGTTLSSEKLLAAQVDFWLGRHWIK